MQHFCSSPLSSSFEITQKILVLSANRWTSDVTQSGRSFIKITNNNGPSTDPCGIPDVTGFHDYSSPWTITSWVRFPKKFSIHDTAFGFIPYFDSL